MKRWIATTENEWGSLSHKYIPRQLALRGKKVLEGYDCGDSSLYNFNYIENSIELATQPTASICTVIPYEQTNPNPFETKVTESENWSYNLLNLPPQFPEQSCIVGGDTNRQNIRIEEQDGIPYIIHIDGLNTNREQRLLKFPYLFRS